MLLRSATAKESAIVVSAGSLLMLVLSLPAFKYFFFAENFIYLHIYKINENNLMKAAFSRMGDRFFRPVFFFADIWWHYVLPLDPMFYHIRNLVFCVINLFLLHRVLLRFVHSRTARLIALFLFAASKIHLTIIGYLNAYEVSVLLMFMLLTVLFWFRYLETRKISDYILTILFCAITCYSKENGFLIVIILAAMVFALQSEELKTRIGYWGIRFFPLVSVGLSYWVLRFILIGSFNQTNALYAPVLSFQVALWQAKAFLATVGNFALTNPDLIGSRGFSGVFANDSIVMEYVLCVLLYLLIAFTLWRGRQHWKLLLVPVLWIALYLSPIFLIRNHQVYYHQEPLVGMVLLIGIALTYASKRLFLSWSLVVALVATNGFISNYRSYYPWQYCSNLAEVIKPIVEANRANPPEQITLVSPPNSYKFWLYTVGDQLIPHLLGSPETEVRVVDSPDRAASASVVYYLP